MTAAEFTSTLTQIFNFLCTIWSAMWQLYANYPILGSVIALWFLDRVVGIFDLIKG